MGNLIVVLDRKLAQEMFLPLNLHHKSNRILGFVDLI
jgi:hypothetical protein